jgi:hypothetical protein
MLCVKRNAVKQGFISPMPRHTLLDSLAPGHVAACSQEESVLAALQSQKPTGSAYVYALVLACIGECDPCSLSDIYAFESGA